MGLPGHPFRAVAERRPAIIAPRHFEHSGTTGQLSNAQGRTERAIGHRQVRLEGFEHDSAEHGLLLLRQGCPAPFEAGKRLERCHHTSAPLSFSR